MGGYWALSYADEADYTVMAVLTVNNVKKMFGTDVIIRDITFEVQKGDHIGLVGINGSGKTTLFKILSGEYDCDEGAFFSAKETSIGYMEQHVCKNADISAYSEVLSVFSNLIEMEDELEKINHRLQVEKDGLNSLILQQTTLNDRFVDSGGLTFRNRARSTMIGLGFTEDQLSLPVGVLSGGQKGKLQLAKMLLGGANLLLLDEPTNHLDITATEWLEDFLKNYSGSFIVISHDRYFLDSVTNRIFELENKRLTAYKGNYTAYQTQKSEKRLSMQRVYDNTQKEIKRIEGIIQQQKRFNQERNYVTIASKQKSIDRLEATLERPEDEPDVINFQFRASRRGGNDVLMAENLSLSFDDKQIFSDVNLQISRQERIFLIGPNGCGKTSLLKVLLGSYKPDGGEVKFGANIDVGYYDQAQDNLDEGKTVIDEIWDLHPRMSQTEVRNALAVFLFRGEEVFKPVKGLSGGERARVLLLKLMLADTNFLILDEPTNHLDITSREALEDALKGYDGTMLVVSHDRYLINKLADKVLYLDSEGITEYKGNYDAYLEQKADIPQEAAVAAKVNEYKLNKERKAFIRKQRSALAMCEKQIEETEQEISRLERSLCDPETAADYEKTIEISACLEKLKAETDSLMTDWEELHTWLDENGMDEK